MCISPSEAYRQAASVRHSRTVSLAAVDEDRKSYRTQVLLACGVPRAAPMVTMIDRDHGSQRTISTASEIDL